MIDLRQVLTGEPVRLRYIKRFSICPRVHEESVAEHSYYVAFISLMLAEDLKNQCYRIDVGLLLSRALLHDLDEVFSGDFIRMFKHHNEDVNREINCAATELVANFLQNYPAGDQRLEYWEKSKEEDIEGRILGFADFLSVVSYIWQEIHAGNVIMLQHLPELEKFARSFTDPSWKFLAGYLFEAVELIKEMRGAPCNPPSEKIGELKIPSVVS